MSTISHHDDGLHSPLVTLSTLDVSISAETRHGGDEVHLLLGPVTLILLPDQAADVADALHGVALTQDRSSGS